MMRDRIRDEKYSQAQPLTNTRTQWFAHILCAHRVFYKKHNNNTTNNKACKTL